MSEMIVLDFNQPSYSGPSVPGEYGLSLGTLLEIVRELKNISSLDITSEEGLTSLVRTVLKVAEVAGLPAEMLDKAREVLNNPAAFSVLLAIIRYVYQSIGGGPQHVYEYRTFPISPADFQKYIGLALALLDLWRNR